MYYSPYFSLCKISSHQIGFDHFLFCYLLDCFLTFTIISNQSKFDCFYVNFVFRWSTTILHKFDDFYVSSLATRMVVTMARNDKQDIWQYTQRTYHFKLCHIIWHHGCNIKLNTVILRYESISHTTKTIINLKI